ncbi:AcrR family transcriptional regulator [Litorivivens lipolytica]|uniref:AcrR family transcriptional regulator n=1 Tax=Litorivivens lipolytica TaxID=1524264 RepID=A0A7W4W5W4_9GAMM|nr:AcrR family transcriptional regulator [Litorivivens lipolytica]
MLAADGPDALSLSKVANLAGVNRGTAYQHFETRADLIDATVEWVSDHLASTIFGEIEAAATNFGEKEMGENPLFSAVDGLVNFAVDNPALCRIWLFEVLASRNPGEDKFFRQFKQSIQQVAESELAQPSIDVEALSVILLAGYFLWPVWVGSQAKSKKEREHMKSRMRREVLRLCLHGVVDVEDNGHILKFIREREKQRSGVAVDW